ncbi:hypothetical protein ACPYO6_07285 [Georgenia sp. Z1344]|uniref:hypothetical protein n=1 Tax=Georgenia sp. Z1344 TaxID=3416706 RepID=UPI003CE83365
MSTGYGWNEQDPYAHGDPQARGVYPEHGRSGQFSGADPSSAGSPGAAQQPSGGQSYGNPGYTGQNYGGQNYGGQNYAGQAYGGQQPYGGQNLGGPDLGPRNDYGRAPADTDAGRGGAHKASVAAIAIYVGLFVGLPVLIALIGVAVAL